MIRSRATAGIVLLLAAIQVNLASAQPAAAPEPSEAQRREQARTLGYSGVRAFGEGDYTAASEQLERSFSLLPVPSLGLWSARALVKLGKLVEAEQRYRAVAKMRVAADDSDVQRAARETAQAELLELLPRIPSLRVQVAGAPPQAVAITLDGVPLPHERWQQGEPVNPGQHQLAGVHQGERVLLDISASEGRESEALLSFSARRGAEAASLAPRLSVAGAATPIATTAPPAELDSVDSWQLGGWLLVGAAGIGLGVSVVTYLLAQAQHDELQTDGSCQGRRCQPSPGLDRYEDLRAGHLVSLVGGLALGVGGATILLLKPGQPTSGAVSPGSAASGSLSQRSLELRWGLGSVSLGGHF